DRLSFCSLYRASSIYPHPTTSCEEAKRRSPPRRRVFASSPRTNWLQNTRRYPMVQATPDSTAIKEQVREHYGSRIQSATSCCGPSAASSCCAGSSGASCCDTPTEIVLYGAEALAALPADVTTTSFGCGNPVALASLKPGEVALDLGSG